MSSVAAPAQPRSQRGDQHANEHEGQEVEAHRHERGDLDDPLSHERLLKTLANGRAKGHDTSSMNPTKPLFVLAPKAWSRKRMPSNPSIAVSTTSMTAPSRSGSVSEVASAPLACGHS
jgi:hypothetical protein